MKYYVMQVRSMFEEKYIRLCKNAVSGFDIKLYFPKREYMERRQGKSEKVIKPVFLGYVFLELEDSLRIEDLQQIFRKVEGFHRFLRSNDDVTEITGRDLEIILRFLLNKDAIAGISKAYFNEKDKIVITEGPLFGLEGSILKVDKRKGRVKVKLDFCSESFTVDLGFETINKA
ncbi:MAG: antiterminator LoaP [Spirochaetaceae bacterium]|jgi:transcriptional antiterminator NusG|nr:antiterminator LoaP [Spirochaetaceae bacterium]